ncbi:unnamed protein product [Medioppia subpectinata]|uniref:Uncharacterized protein n=1 Tax=Medioppia subpectinata TaxID=1979941 RepID=A0A7R9PUF3_9ACAR|nr:unnamed protein product [Medioppia subpectinata]CAG2101473.1 unnamed protein product [Medioppia subpectinata]
MKIIVYMMINVVALYGCGVWADYSDTVVVTDGLADDIFECDATIAEDVVHCLKLHLPEDIDASNVVEYGCCMMYNNHYCTVKTAKAKCDHVHFLLKKSLEDEKRDNSFEDCKDFQQCNNKSAKIKPGNIDM